VKTERGERVFLVRVWRESGEPFDAREWRGSVYEIESGIRFYVTGTRDIADFVAARLAVKKPDQSR
jgi:hypothetical protein